MANIMTKRGSQDNMVTYEHICDTRSDLANIDSAYVTLGSVALVLKGEDGLEVYMASSTKEWEPLILGGSAGGGGEAAGSGFTIHVCTNAEIDNNGFPNIAVPDPATIYFVPNDGNVAGNIYKEYVYVNSAWEKFGDFVDNSQVTNAVNAWLTAHPEATTTVADGAVTAAKLGNDIKSDVLSIPDLKSKKADKEVVNFNLWNEQYIIADLNTTTGEVKTGNRVVSKQFIKVAPQTNYYFKNPTGTAQYILFYDSGYNFISHFANSSNSIFTTVANCEYIKFCLSDSYGTTYNHDVCINKSQPDISIDPHNGQYVSSGGFDVVGEILSLKKKFLLNEDTLTLTSAIVRFDKETASHIVNATLPPSAIVIGRNLFNAASRVTGKIKNDSGVEVSDNNSNYYDFYIPVHNLALVSSFVVERYYLYDSSKTFLGRTTAVAPYKKKSFADNVYFVQVQMRNTVLLEHPCIVYEGSEVGYIDHYYSDSGVLPTNQDFAVYTDGVNDCSVTLTATNIKAYVPPIESYAMWEPTTATDDYKCTPLGQYTQSIPALTNTLTYLGFLATYFDPYVGEHDGYIVTKNELGLDSGAEATGNIACPVCSYEFRPKHYNRTVLLSAGMNTCEASTYFGLAYFIKALMEHTEDGMAALYNTTRFVVMPVICPSGIMHDPLLYPNSNGVRINKNFEYYNSWNRLKEENGGNYPDSEIETKYLKEWLNKYNNADLWIDCHSDTQASTATLHLGTFFCGDYSIKENLSDNKNTIVTFYRNKGYYTSSDNPTINFVEHNHNNAIYPKTQYAYEVLGIPSVIFEQFEYSTAWGSDGNTNNDSFAIKHYVAILRYLILEACKGSGKIVH